MKQIQEENLSELGIIGYIHCGKCVKEWKSNDKLNQKFSPKEYARTQAGWTKKGIQVWCNRHDCNIVHIDFEGQKHPASTTA